MATQSILIYEDPEQALEAHRGGRDAWWLYAREVLSHLRLPFRVVGPDQIADVAELDPAVLLFTCPPDLRESDLGRVGEWIASGGSALVYGGPGSLGSLIATSAGSEVGNGYVRPVPGADASGEAYEPFSTGGTTLIVSGAKHREIARWGGGEVAAVEVPLGKGVVEVWAADPWQSIVRIQQGWPVTKPGEVAPDGSVPRVDGVLRCDDGLAIPFDDRRMPPGFAETNPFEITYPPAAAAPMYDRPHADHWRALVLRAINRLALQGGRSLVWLHYWPAGVPAIAHMSHDSDGNQDSHARAALAAFCRADVRVTWCQCHPGGYSAETIEAIAAAGHEHALHYNAMGDTGLDTWGAEYLRDQHAWAEQMCGVPIVSNKNHYTRWEGYDDFYAWCEEIGIELDESRGPSKQGDAGFTFGSAHPWFPMSGHDTGNATYDVLELPLHTQDLGWAMHPSVRDVILDGSLDVHGVAHFLFHGTHIEGNVDVFQAVVDVANEGRDRGMPWWTATQINDWERSRRQVEILVEDVEDSAGGSGGAWVVRVHAGQPLANAGIVLSVPPSAHGYSVLAEDGQPAAVSEVHRHGMSVLEVEVDLGQGPVTLRIAPHGA